MKTSKNIMMLALVAICMAPFGVDASTVVRSGDMVSVAADQRVEGDFYLLASQSAIQGDVTGDVVGAVGAFAISNHVGGDVMVLAGTVNLGETASVTDDLRIIGGDVVIAGEITDSLVVVGNSLRILSTGKVGGDVLFLGREMVTEGVVSGQVIGRAEKMRIDGEVGGGMDVTVGYLTLGDEAKVTGNIRYVSPADMNRALNASVTGDIVKSDVPDVVAPVPVSYRSVAVSFLISLFATLSLFLLFRRPLTTFAKYSAERFGISALLGAAMLVLLPLILTLLLVSVLGLFLGLMGLAIFLLLIVVAIPLVNVVVAGLLTKILLHKTELNVIWITVAAVLVQVCLLVPIIGPVLLFVVVLSTFGALASGIYGALRRL